MEEITSLVGFGNFKRTNPMSDLFESKKFHHLEFWCQDATNVARRFACALGMQMVARSDVGTGNVKYTSYVLKSNDITMVFTAPYWTQQESEVSSYTFQSFDRDFCLKCLEKHGLFVRAVGLLVGDADAAVKASLKAGARPGIDAQTVGEAGAQAKFAEVELYGSTVLRYVSYHGYTGAFLPGYTEEERPDNTYGLIRIDHVVGNVPKLLPQVNYMRAITGFHEFAEFTAEDVGTVDSGLNSMVLANNSEYILMPVNEPTTGTKRRSQIQTYLDHHQGAGVQHIALKSNDIFHTLREMRKHSSFGGLEFMPRPSDAYYRKLPSRIGDTLTEDQYKQVEELGILVDRDDQGTLLQLFTRPVTDRPTLFIEIIQRVGCDAKGTKEQAAGCGGFGKGNFSELFKSIEDFEKEMDEQLASATNVAQGGK